MVKNFINLSLISLFFGGCTSNKITFNHPIHESMSLINDISYVDPKFDNKNAGNGFIVSYEGNNYALTAKHVLMVAKTDQMESVSLTGHLKQWKMYQKNNAQQYVIIDQLLNSNKNEKLEWETLSDDWLVFSIKQNRTNFEPLKFRHTPLIKGEKLYAIGWTYQDTEGPQRSYEFKFHSTENGQYSLEQITGPKKLSGLSGSPVVDDHGLLIGLVASGWVDEETNVSYLLASKASDIQNFIKNK